MYICIDICIMMKHAKTRHCSAKPQILVFLIYTHIYIYIYVYIYMYNDETRQNTPL